MVGTTGGGGGTSPARGICVVCSELDFLADFEFSDLDDLMSFTGTAEAALLSVFIGTVEVALASVFIGTVEVALVLVLLTDDDDFPSDFFSALGKVVLDPLLSAFKSDFVNSLFAAATGTFLVSVVFFCPEAGELAATLVSDLVLAAFT